MIYAMGFMGLALAWLLPGHYFPWTGFQQEVLAALGTSLVAVAAIVSTEGRPLPLPRLVIVAALLAAVPLVQWQVGMIPYAAEAVLPTLYLLAFALAVVASAGVYAAKGTHYVAGLATCFVAGSIACAGVGLVQWLQLGNFDLVEIMDAGARVYGNLVQPNQQASVLTLGIVGVLWCFEARRVRAAVAWLAVGFLGLGLAMTQSRAGWLAVCVIAAWSLVSRRRLSMRTAPAAVLAGCAALSLLFVYWRPLNDLLYLGTAYSFADRAQSGTRPLHWATMLDAALRSPWFGYGWQQVSPAQQVATLDHAAAHEWLGYSHDLLLDLMIWNGVPLGLLVFVLIVAWLASRMRACRDIDSWAMLAGLVALFSYSLVEFPYAYLFFLLPLALMVGVVEVRQAQSRGVPTTLHLSRPAFALVFVGLMGMLAWVWSDYMDIEEAARRVRLKEAGYIASGQPPEVPDVSLLDSQREFLRFRLGEAKPGMSPAELDWMRTVTQHFAPPAALLRYALAAGLNGREAEAKRTLALLCHIWEASHCEEGRSAWASAQQKFAVLKGVAFPIPETVPQVPVAKGLPVFASSQRVGLMR